MNVSFFSVSDMEDSASGVEGTCCSIIIAFSNHILILLQVVIETCTESTSLEDTDIFQSQVH